MQGNERTVEVLHYEPEIKHKKTKKGKIRYCSLLPSQHFKRGAGDVL